MCLLGVLRWGRGSMHSMSCLFVLVRLHNVPRTQHKQPQCLPAKAGVAVVDRHELPCARRIIHKLVCTQVQLLSVAQASWDV